MIQVKKSFKDLAPKLYIIGTPIGNLADFSYRAQTTLQAVDKIYCEDTRTSKVLLDHFQIKNKLVAWHKFNEAEIFETVLADIQQGLNLALISDAGVPCISDPGAKVLNKLVLNNVLVDIVPINCGPAFIHAQIMSGFEAKRSEFLGFLDKKSHQIIEQLKSLTQTENKIITFYESVHRIITTINLLVANFAAHCRVAIAREITKLNEEIIIGTLSEVWEFVNSQFFVQKGEFVVVLDKGLQLKLENTAEIDHVKLVDELVQQGISKKDAIKQIAKQYGLNRNDFYQKNIKKRT